MKIINNNWVEERIISVLCHKSDHSLEADVLKSPSNVFAVFQYTRHIFGAKDSLAYSNYALQRIVSDNAEKYPQTARSVQSNFTWTIILSPVKLSKKQHKKAQDLVHLLGLGDLSHKV